MSDERTRLRAFSYQVELLEDLHAGSGLGSVWVDRTLARDSAGVAVIPASHVKGVWRDAAVRLAELEVPGFDSGLIDQWFGSAPGRGGASAAPRRGRLVCPRLVPTDASPESLVWTQTARVPGSRRPHPDTLRSTEYLPAGLRMEGQGFFCGTDQEFELLSRLVHRVVSYGGARSRGDGRVRLTKIEASDPGAVEVPSAEAAHGGVRLLLEALAPVQVPLTGSPGNIIESDTRIPGRMLLGAISRALLDGGVNPEVVFRRGRRVGDALPLAPSTETSGHVLARLQVLPAPLEYRAAKPEVKAISSFQHCPAWAREPSAGRSVDEWVDLLNHRDDSAPLKRLPAGMYIQREGDGPWRAYRQGLELAMRNRRGSAVNDAQRKPDLFSSEQLPAATRFIADIRPGSQPADWAGWFGEFGRVIASRPLVFVGRGGAPVRIAAVQALAEQKGHQAAAQAGSFRLTLTSDAIIRTPWLGFHQRLTLAALGDALGIEIPAGLVADDVSEWALDRAFNAASGLPRPSVVVLKRGSSILVSGDAKAVGELRSSLDTRDALGDRQDEGLGRFVLDLSLGQSERIPAGRSEQAPPLGTEEVARFARQLYQGHRQAFDTPSNSQLGNLRATLDGLPRGAGPEAVGAVRQKLQRAAADTRAGAALTAMAAADGPLAELERKYRDGWTVDDVRLTFRLAVAQAMRPAAAGDVVGAGSGPPDSEEREP